MSSHPRAVIIHTAHASRAHDEDRERAAIEAQLGFEVPMARTPAESRTLLADAEIAFGAGLSERELEAANSLQWVQAFSSGVDSYPLDSLRERGIILTNVAGIHSEPIAEQILGYMLMFARKLHQGGRQQAQPRWERYEGGELAGKTLGIVGVGAVGSRLAEFASVLDMTVLGIKRTPETAPDTVDECWGPDDLDALLPKADYVALTCPLNEDTRGMIDADALAAMHNSAILINVARGGVVDDYRELEIALQQHEIGGAALDVFPEEPYDLTAPIWGLPNVLITPHMAGSSPRKPDRIAEIVADNFEKYQAGAHDEMPTRVL